MKTEHKEYYFQPTFGNKPEEIVGRDGEIRDFMNGLRAPVGARERATLFLGQRGMGKTALLLEIAERASNAGYVVARVTAIEGMPEAIIEQIQLNGSKYFKDEKKHISGLSAGALGFSFGLSFSDSARQQYGFRSKMSLLCDRLAEKDIGVLILIDEAHSSPQMREVAASYQELVGDGKNVALAMAGLPYAVSDVLNDKVLTFLNRANKVTLDAISTTSICAYYERAFRAMSIKCSDEIIRKAAECTMGLPYLMQLIGYYLTMYSKGEMKITEKILQRAVEAATVDLEDNVFKPTISPLSDNDRMFLKAMAECDEPVQTSELKKRIKGDGAALQPYRKRLLDTGIIEAPRRGELVFAIPYFKEYLKKNNS